jgi:hypothetical protein
MELKRDIAAADRAAANGLREMRACEKSMHFFLDQAMALNRKLAEVQDRRDPGRRASGKK